LINGPAPAWRLTGQRRSLALVTPLFAFNREAIAAELSSAPNDEYLVNLEVAWTERPPTVPGFVPVHSAHPAIEAAAVKLGLPYSEGMEIPVDVVILAVENELKGHGCQFERDDNPTKHEVLARWTWPPLT
jgi:hypothetical protein